MNARLRGSAASKGDAGARAEYDSPFIAAKREWNERYGDYIAQARNWRIAAILSLMITAVLAGGTIWLAAQTKLVPYVIEVDKLGQSVAVARADRAPTADQEIVRAQIASWISDARAVSSDPTAQRAMLTRVYSLIGANAKPYLDDWYRTHSPFEAGTKHTVAVHISAVLPVSAMTYAVQWAEEQRDPDGTHPLTTHWEANLSVGLKPPSDEATILRNPMGIYVTQLNWTQRL